MSSRVVLITGASSGIGKAIALKFAALDCKLVIHGTNKKRLEETSYECLTASTKGYKPISVIGSFEDLELTAKSLFEQTKAAYNRLDVLVNNAGAFKKCNLESEKAYENFEETMNTNLNAPVRISLLFIPLLKASKGCIINISSNAHKKCFVGASAYCASKAALTMYSKSLAIELAPFVRVNSISPGPVATYIHVRNGVDLDDYRTQVGSECLTNRVGEPEDIARLVVFLAAPESSFITGSDYIIDGGSTIKPETKLMGSD